MSSVHELRSLEAQIAELTKRRDEISPLVQERLDLFAKITQTLDSRGISRREMALELCPELATGKAGKTVGTRRARAIKQYKNPHNGEIVETKGGNHKVLKAWKAKYGNDEVESWVQKQA